MNRKQYWAALTKDGEILTVGITMFGRFEKCCLRLSFGGYGKWVADGSRYTELFVDSLRDLHTRNFMGVPTFIYGLNVKDFSHGRIRRCKSARRFDYL